MTDRHWYDLGKFRVLAMPLPTNPAFTTHHVYLEQRLVGRQLSVPTLEDCQHMLDKETAEALTYAEASRGLYLHRKPARKGARRDAPRR